MSDSSLIGVPSCFSGGRKIGKWTRSTDAADLSRFRQVRSPAFGSPETKRTRNLSRTPSMATTARLLTAVSSPVSGEASISTRFWPACGIAISARCGTPTRTLRVSMTSPSRRTVTAAVGFVLAPGDEGVNWSGKAEGARVGGYVVYAAVGNHDGAGDAIGRHVGKRCAKCAEQPRAVGFAVRLTR